MKPPDQGDNTCFSLKHPCCGTLCKQPAQIKANTISPCHSFDKCVAELLRIWAFRNAWRWLLWLGRQLQTDLVLFFFYRCFVLFLAFCPDWSAAQGQIFFIYFLFAIQVTWTVLLAYGWHSIKICCLNDWILCWELKDLTITSSWVDGCSTISQKWAKGLLISIYKGFPQQIIVGQFHKEKH